MSDIPKQKGSLRDRELNEYRGIMDVPSVFDEGFNWTAVLGAVFVATLMVPGALYMGLLAGVGNIGTASQWVTVILFIEVAKRMQKQLKRAEIYILFFMAGAVMSMPYAGLIWNQYFVRSPSAVANGIADLIPSWFAPPSNSTSYSVRSFFHWDWLAPIGLMVFTIFFSQLSEAVLGYGLFRIASDVEKLPFPMAPVQAQGIMALAEDADTKRAENNGGNWRWRVFSIGGALGLLFGAVYLLLPTLSGALTGTAIQIFDIPFSDFTQRTGEYLPAVATGMSWDLGNLLFGMVLPFFAMVGSIAGLVMTMVANPIMYRYGILHSWRPGESTVTTLYLNNIDFYFSFQIGLALAVAVVGIWQVVRGVIVRMREKKAGGQAAPIAPSCSTQRGDVGPWHVLAVYLFITVTYILLCGWLIGWHRGIMIVLVVLGFVYTPLMSYVTARLEGMVGQIVEVPMIREASLILSGYRGVACWFLPIPLANYGLMAVRYKSCELTGTKFSSMWKTQIVLFPIILISSVFFMNFVWGLSDIPSPIYPFADRMWKLNAENACIMYSATLGEYSTFERAFRLDYTGVGAVFGVALFALTGWLGAPVMLAYGIVRGLGQAAPHSIVPQFIGALIGRYYFRKKLGLTWLQYVPVVSAGFACGMGLITTIGVGITFLSRAAVPLKF